MPLTHRHKCTEACKDLLLTMAIAIPPKSKIQKSQNQKELKKKIAN